jgi:uncharacterized phage protein (TIGR02220 family)
LKTKPFYKALSEQPPIYSRVWVFILGNYGDTITFSQISSNVGGCSKSYISLIIQWGLKKMKLHHIEYEYNSTPKGIVFTFSVYKVVVAKDESLVTEIVNYLNEKSEKNFSPTSKETIKVIEARIKEGSTLQDFKKVIDIKCEKWLKSNMEDYLRPITLFGNKFNSYLNETPTIKRVSNIEKTITTAIETSNVDWGLDK